MFSYLNPPHFLALLKIGCCPFSPQIFSVYITTKHNIHEVHYIYNACTTIFLCNKNSSIPKQFNSQQNSFEYVQTHQIFYYFFYPLWPLLLQHKVLSWNPLYFGCKLEHLWGQASVFLSYRKCCYILHIWSFLSAFTESLTIGMLNILDCYSNFSLFIICHLFLMLYIWDYLLQFIFSHLYNLFKFFKIFKNFLALRLTLFQHILHLLCFCHLNT